MMNLMKRVAFASIGAALIFCPQTQAEVNGADSLEWLACASEVIVLGQITSSRVEKGPGDVIYEDCVLRVTETIKGKETREISFCYRHFPRDDISWLRPRAELLVFLSRWQDSYEDERIHLYVNPYYEARMHKLLVPTQNREPLSVFDLRNPPHHVFDRDGRQLLQRDEILSIARAWAKAPIVNYLERDAAYDSDAFQQLRSGSAVWLKVPAEEKYRPEFMKLARSEDVFERTKAAAELGKYPGRETEEVLRRLLDDTTESQSLFAADVIWEVRYPVREAAYRSLKKLGISVPELAFQRPATPDEKRQLRISYWSNSFRQALPPDWKIVSVDDGPTKSIVTETLNGKTVKTRDVTIVVVKTGKGATAYGLTLVPVEWPSEDTPFGDSLGVYSLDAQGARIFLCDQTLPQDLRRQLIKYYNLAQPPWLPDRLAKRVSRVR
jgi:hypothetical protein